MKKMMKKMMKKSSGVRAVNAKILKRKIREKASPFNSQVSQGFFKTGPGEYGEGDIFIGVKMPDLRLIAKTHIGLAVSELKILLDSSIHEDRMLALVILTLQFKNAQKLEDIVVMKKCYQFYMSNLRAVNNWDLVDVTAPILVGAYLFSQNRSILVEMAKSKQLWERRIAIVSTHYFIRQNDFSDTLKLAKILLKDTHDLIHKAVGWMLREVGKKDEAVLIKFLNAHASAMPRTMLRYAIERLSPVLRFQFLNIES